MRLEYNENPEVDVEEVAALRKAVGWEPRKEQLQQIVGCTYMTVICRDSGNLVGYVDVISDGVDDAFIRNLLVHPDYQRRGIALNLLQIIVRRIKADRIKTANVLFEPALTDLYREAGFRIICGGIMDNEKEGF